MHRYGVPYWATLPAAALICFALGVLFGLPALRFEGPYLALVTLAMAFATPQLLKYFDTWTGGQQGLNLVKPLPPPGSGLDRDRWLYLVVLAVLLIGMRVAANVLHGRTGRALVAIRDHPIAATAMGINAARYKTLAFGTSTLFTGVAGALSALVIGFVAPESFSLFLSLSFLVGSAVGGIATIGGAIVGGLFIEFVPNLRQRHFRCRPVGGLRSSDAGVHVRDAARRGRLAGTLAGAAGPAHSSAKAQLVTKTAKGGCHDSEESHRGQPVGGRRRPRPRSLGRTRVRGGPIWTRRQRHRDQDRQHHAVQRTGVVLWHSRQSGCGLLRHAQRAGRHQRPQGQFHQPR